MARTLAVNRALTQAVGQLAARLVDPATLRTRMNILAYQILSKARSFVTTYNLAGSVQHQGSTLVLVTVHVDKQALLTALDQAGLRLEAGSLPLTLVLIAEESAPGRPASFWWSGVDQAPAIPASISRVLDSLGVKTVDPATLAKQVPEEARRQVLNEDQALKLARLAGAGLVLMGRVRTFPLVTPQGSNPPPVAQLMALDAVKGVSLAVVEEDGPDYGETPGPEASAEVVKAVEAAVRSLLDKVVAGRGPSISQVEGSVTMEVTGVKHLADLHRFEEVISSLHAYVRSMVRESVAPGLVTFRLKLKVPAATLADQLLLQEYGSFLVNVQESQPGVIKVVLIPKQ